MPFLKNLKKLFAPAKRNGHDVWPTLWLEGHANVAKELGVKYMISEGSMGSSLSIEATTEQYCIYCKEFDDPEFNDPAFPDGGGYCRRWNGAVGFKDSCNRWEHNTRVRAWLSKEFMAVQNSRPYPRRVWYQLFEDPDGRHGAGF